MIFDQLHDLLRGRYGLNAVSGPVGITEEIGKAACAAREVYPETAVVVDNCYGEFVDTTEPCAVGADLIAGSLIKNPGGGLAPMGGYVAGRADLVECAAERLSVPGFY